MAAWSVEIDPAHSHGPMLASVLDHGRPPASLALSHGSSASNPARLRATLDWLAPRVGSLVVVEGSYLARWNRMAFDPVSEADARREAAAEASLARRRIERVLGERCPAARFLDWAELAGSPEVRDTTLALDRHANEDAAFGAAVRREIADYVGRTRGIDPASLPEECRERLAGYIVEETAVLLELQRRGFPVEVYHGPDLPLLAAIGAGRFPGLPFACPGRTHLSLRLVKPLSSSFGPP